MQPKFIAGVVIGVLIMYLGLFNIAGFGLTLSLTGTFYTEDFSYTDWEYDHGSWQIAINPAGITINPAGQLQMTAPWGIGDTRRTAMMDASLLPVPEQYTVEWRMKIDQIGEGTPAGEQSFGIYAATYWIPLAFRPTLISAYQGPTKPAVNYNINVVGQTHTWTMVVDHTATTVDLWMDTQKLMTFPTVIGGGGSKVSLDGYGGSSSATLVHFDWIYLDTGLNPPGGSSTGSIVATCTLDGNAYSGVSVSASGPNSGQATSGSNGIATISNLPVATGYTVTATPPNGQIASQTITGVSVTANNPTSLSFAFATPTPGTGSYTVQALDSAGHTITNTPCYVSISGGYPGHNAPWTFSSLPYGTYTVTATWKGETKSDSKTLSSSLPSVSVTWTFSSSDGGSPPIDPLAAIRAFIAQYNAPITIGGFFIMLISSILMVLPKKYLERRAQPSSTF